MNTDFTEAIGNSFIEAARERRRRRPLASRPPHVVLGVPEDACEQEIFSSYVWMSRLHIGDTEATPAARADALQEIEAAYALLNMPFERTRAARTLRDQEEKPVGGRLRRLLGGLDCHPAEILVVLILMCMMVAAALAAVSHAIKRGENRSTALALRIVRDAKDRYHEEVLAGSLPMPKDRYDRSYNMDSLGDYVPRLDELAPYLVGPLHAERGYVPRMEEVMAGTGQRTLIINDLNSDPECDPALPKESNTQDSSFHSEK